MFPTKFNKERKSFSEAGTRFKKEDDVIVPFDDLEKGVDEDE